MNPEAKNLEPKNLEQLNRASDDAAQHFFEQACCAPRWVAAMTAARPFADQASLLQTASEQWQTMQEADWLAAFEGHPRIGDVESLDKRFANTRATASHEQSGVESASREVLEELLHLNQVYAERFGFIFIVFASGKSAAEMLQLLQQRIDNERAQELRIAAAEQWKITALRLQKQLEA